MSQAWSKRAFDVLFSLAALVATSPLLLLSALALKLDTPGPVFFRQTRVGQGGQDFEILKFRTMTLGAEKAGAGFVVLEGDARITRVGGLLRKSHIDELPQFWNVLCGQMSVVGPRPTLRYQVDQYTPFQMRRLEAKPGITGLAQIKGGNLISWPRRIEYDVEYIDHWSFWGDLRILAGTVVTLLSGRGVYAQSAEVFNLRPGDPEKNGDPGNGH